MELWGLNALIRNAVLLDLVCLYFLLRSSSSACVCAEAAIVHVVWQYCG